MVTDFYGLREEPFGATPDSRYLFESGTHREALASLLYGVQASRGFMALIAKPGMGKTTLLFRGLSQLRKQGRTVFLFQTMLTPLDLLRALLADLGVQDLQGGIFELQAKLNDILVDYSRRSERLVVVIDETQNLDDSVLEMVRMLSNFETQQQKLIQFILSGQPQLAKKLRSPNLLQLRQRISIVAHLQAFSPEETEHYVEHRLRVAGYSSDRSLFTRSSMQLIAQHSEGIPRNINTLCFNALSIGYALRRRIIDENIVREVISDLDLAPLEQVLATSPAQHIEISAPAPALRSIPSLAGWATKSALATALLLLLTGVPISAGRHTTVLADAREAANLATKPPSVPAAAPNFSSPPAAVTDGERASGTMTARPTAAPIAHHNSDIPGAVVPSQVRDSAHLAVVPAPSSPPAKLRVSAAVMPAHSIPDAHKLQLDAQERILVPPGVTLYEICRETMKECHSKDIEAIRRLNPWLTNPNHLESGRKLTVPPVA